MSIEETMAGILTEAAEHVDAIEPILVAAERTSPDRSQINLLFRSVHSLKGLAKLASAESVEMLVHDAESHLAGLRNHAAPLGADAVDALLALLDVVRSAITAGDLRRATVDPALMASLAGLARRSDDADASTARGKTLDDAERLVGLEPEMAVALWELLVELLPEMAHALADGAENALDEATGVLDNALDRVGLLGFREAVRRFREASPDRRPASFSVLLDFAEMLGAIRPEPDGTVSALDEIRAHYPAPAVPAFEREEEFAGADALRARLVRLGIAPSHVTIADVPASRRGVSEPGARLVELVFPLPDADGIAELAEALDILSGLTIEGAEGRGLALLAWVSRDANKAAGVPPSVMELASQVTWLDERTPPRHFGAPAKAVPANEEAQMRVPVELLDRLFGRIGAFFSIGSRLNVMATESRVDEALRRISDHAATRAPELATDVEALLADRRDFRGLEAEIGHLISLVHESTLGLRVIPFETVVSRFPRMVRDSAKALGKVVRFDLESYDIKIDKGMADMLLDPLMHMLRNAVDHGLETAAERVRLGKSPIARLSLKAEQAGNRLLLTISDDGRGIELDKVRRKALAQRLVGADDLAGMSDAQVARLIFRPGFSTRDQVTDLSGRGVGMDVVLNSVTRLGGRIDIESRPGQGASFRLDMPLSASIRPMLLASTGVQLLGFPDMMIAEAVVMPQSEVQQVNGQPSILLHDRFLPIFETCDLMGLPRGVRAAALELPIVVCRWNGRRAGFIVQQILRRAEMLIRETHLRVAELPGIGGVSTLGADRIVLVLDPDKLMALAGKSATRGLRSAVRAAGFSPRPGSGAA